jgi:hypothetical protein
VVGRRATATFGQALERGVERDGERRLPTDEVLPPQLDAVTLAFRHELQAVRRDRQHVRFVADRDLPLECLVQHDGHGCILAS